MFSALKSNRVVLRAMNASDAEAVFAYRKDEITNAFQSWLPKSKVEVENFILRNPSEFNQSSTWFQLSIISSDNHEIVGDIGVRFLEDNNPQCEIGITLAKQFHGKGLAKEALNLLLNHLFVKLNKHRIFASIDPRNTSAEKLLKSLHFRKEGHFKQSYFHKGRWADDVIYGLLQSEWKGAI